MHTEKNIFLDKKYKAHRSWRPRKNLGIGAAVDRTSTGGIFAQLKSRKSNKWHGYKVAAGGGSSSTTGCRGSSFDLSSTGPCPSPTPGVR